MSKKNRMKKQMVTAYVICLLVVSSFAVYPGPRGRVRGDESEFTWEDDFLDWSSVDLDMSYNIEKKEDKIFMKNTYEAWHYPWPKMKELHIKNTGAAQPNYVLPIEVYHEPAMQLDYSDLRFVNIYNDTVYDLEYWIGDYDQYKADVWIRVTPGIPNGNSTIYMFYGDKNAPDHSKFDIIFKWDDRTDPDIMISHKNYLEGAWDPDVDFTNGRFLVTWEERLGPEDLPNHMERARYSDIRGRTYDSDGGDPEPDPDDNEDIEIMVDADYHGEDPSVASDGDKYFVVWEENPASIVNRYKIDIKGALVTTNGVVTPLSDPICGANNIQEDACVAYSNGKYLMVREDARLGTGNYNIWGRYYNPDGSPASNEFQITSGANYEGQPWVCGDGKGFFLVVYEKGDHPENGPFGISAKKLDSLGNTIWTSVIVAGEPDRDNIWPSVNYNPNTDQYLITWNDGDLSEGHPRGNIWGDFVNQDGSSEFDNFIIQPGSKYIRTDVVPYLGKMFFVSYDKKDEIWGKLVYNKNGRVVMTEEQALSDGSSKNVDWNDLAVSNNGRIFSTWEDERDQASEYADAFGSVWHIYKTTGSPLITYKFGYEKDLITDAGLISKTISVDELQVHRWKQFFATYNYGDDGAVQFYILDAEGNTLHSGLGDLSNIPVEDIRLKASFARSTGCDSPYVDKWGVNYSGTDLKPPWTEIYTTPDEPDGENGWYKKTVDVKLRGYDDESGVESIHYKINNNSEVESKENPCLFTLRKTGIYDIEYWSVDKAGNIEDHNFKQIKIDDAAPKIVIIKPGGYEVDPGDIEVEFTVEETGAGISQVALFLNNNPKPAKIWTENQNKYTYTFHAGEGETYDIEIKAKDNAGNTGREYKRIRTTEGVTASYSPKIGFLYTVNDVNEYLILHIISCAVVIASKLNVKVKPYENTEEVDNVKFTLISKLKTVEINGQDYTSDSDGYYSYLFDPPTGLYQITATYYNVSNGKVGSFLWPGTVVFINTV